MHGRRLVIATAILVVVLPLSSHHVSVSPPAAVRAQSEPAAFVAYYWRARPGRAAEYNDYITNVAVPIDEDARRAGVFEEVRTVMPTPGPDGLLPDWTHLRIFRVIRADRRRKAGP